MNTTPPTHTATRALCAFALVIAPALALAPSSASACSWIYTAHLQWPSDGATDIPPQSSLLVNAVGDVSVNTIGDVHTVRITRADTGAEVAIETLTEYPSSQQPVIPLSYWVVDPVALEPATTYTVRISAGEDYVLGTSTFTTAPTDALPPTPRVHTTRHYFGRYPEPRDICGVFDTQRIASVEATAPYPVLYTFDGVSEAGSGDHNDTPERVLIGLYTLASRSPDDDTPCRTLTWTDMFGRTGTLEALCAPDACLSPDDLPPRGAFWEVDDYFKPEHCDPESPQDDTPQPSTPIQDDSPKINAQDGEDEDVGCATAPHQPSPTLPVLALIALGAWCLRRGRTTP